MIKVAPEGSLQGFQTPYIQDLINMEPCTLWGKFLLGEREDYAFSGPQVRACRGQQPGALSSKWALQPLLTTGLERRQHSNLASRWPVLMAPLRRGGLHRRHDVFSGLVGAGQNPTQETEADFYAEPAGNV